MTVRPLFLSWLTFLSGAQGIPETRGIAMPERMINAAAQADLRAVKLLLPADIDDNVFGSGPCFELDRPVGNAGCHYVIRDAALFMSIDQIVRLDPFPDLIEREKLPAVRMSAQDQVDFRLCLGGKIRRLMIQDDHVLAPVQIPDQVFH